MTDFIQHGEFCARFGFRSRDVRYVLEQGYVPDGMKKRPESGNHRAFDFEQACWLAIAVKLKRVGLPVRRAAAMATWAMTKIRWYASKWYECDSVLYVEFGDLYYFRVVHGTRPGQWAYYFDSCKRDLWQAKPSGVPAPRAGPLEDETVLIRVNMTDIAKRLVGVRMRDREDLHANSEAG